MWGIEPLSLSAPTPMIRSGEHQHKVSLDIAAWWRYHLIYWAWFSTKWKRFYRLHFQCSSVLSGSHRATILLFGPKSYLAKRFFCDFLVEFPLRMCTIGWTQTSIYFVLPMSFPMPRLTSYPRWRWFALTSYRLLRPAPRNFQWCLNGFHAHDSVGRHSDTCTDYRMSGGSRICKRGDQGRAPQALVSRRLTDVGNFFDFRFKNVDF